jgi:anti-sigma factor RsiW
MTCSEYEELIALWAGGDLPDEETARVQAHMEVCEACGAFAAEMRDCRAALAELRGAPAMSVRAAVMARIAESGRHRMWWWKPAAVACAAGLAGFAVWVQGLDTSIPAPPAAPMVRAAVPAHGLEFTPRPVRNVRPAPRREPEPPEAEETFTVKLMTDDPDIVIYWLFAKRGD